MNTKVKESMYEQQRENMRCSIDEAIERLRSTGIRVTRKSIADEIGCHENTMKQPYIREYLSTFEEFQPHGKNTSQMTMEQAMQRIAQLEDALSHSKNRNRTLCAEHVRLRKERDEYEYKYRRLLGRYQVDIGKMKIGF